MTALREESLRVVVSWSACVLSFLLGESSAQSAGSGLTVELLWVPVSSTLAAAAASVRDIFVFGCPGGGIMFVADALCRSGEVECTDISVGGDGAGFPVDFPGAGVGTGFPVDIAFSKRLPLDIGLGYVTICSSPARSGCEFLEPGSQGL